MGCSGSERYTREHAESGIVYPETVPLTNEIRLLIDEKKDAKEILIETESILSDAEGNETRIKPGEILSFSAENNLLTAEYTGNNIRSEYFFLIPADGGKILKFKGVKLRGKLKLFSNRNSVSVINIIDIESYLKGVLPKEMPLGNGEENYEALKALAVCARTYTLKKINPGNNFDLYIDVRDQVYGGVDAEKPLSSRAVDETRNLILMFDNKPAVVFYHSTCGGRTENVKNIFGTDTASYLSGVVDGYGPDCSISPSFEWKEVYSKEIFLERLRIAGLTETKYDIVEDIYVASRFESGRVNELKIDVSTSSSGGRKTVSIFGNEIRSIIRTSDNKSILKSIWFDINLEGSNIIIKGRGYGHGVGLCQWGAIYKSRKGKNFKEILLHYFPGTEIFYLNDKE